MANIRVNLGGTIVNGQPVTFRSPANCSEVNGLIVYYPNGDTTASKTFQFADAHGNNVGSKNLFAADVLVKVLLDTEKSRAYVQNADTNAYLESELAKKLPKDGSGAMTGNLVLEKNTPIMRLRDTTTGSEGTLFNANDRLYLQSQNDGTSDKNRRQIQLINSDAATLDKALTLVEYVEGNQPKGYPIYHAGNKPTVEELGAAPNYAGKIEDTDLLAWAKKQTSSVCGFCDRNITTQNLPADISGYVFVSYSGSGGWAIMYYAPTNSRLFHNSTSGGSWTGWSEVYSTTHKPTAADVGALKVYTTFSALGLTEATATAENIVNAMANSSMLIVNCGTAVATSGFVPYAHGLLTVCKRNTYFTSFEYRTLSGFWIGYYNSASSTGVYWSDWQLVATTDTALMRDGSNAMTGNLLIESNTNKQIDVKNTTSGRTARVHINQKYAQLHNVKDSDNYTAIVLGTEDDTHGNNLRLRVQKDGNPIFYPLYHTGYKPTASDVGAAPNYAGTVKADNLLDWAKSQTASVCGFVSVSNVPNGLPTQYAGYAFVSVTGAGGWAITYFCPYQNSVYYNITNVGSWQGWKKMATTAKDVGALRVYGDLSDLGLTEDTATPEAIANAMDSNSILLHRASATAHTAGAFDAPVPWGLLKVIKNNIYYSTFEYQSAPDANGFRVWRGYYNASAEPKWAGWSKVAPIDSVVSKDGSTAMTGNLNIWKDNPAVGLKHTTSGAGAHFTMTNHEARMQIANVNGVSDNRRYLQLFDSAGKANVADALYLVDLVNGNAAGYLVLHRGNVIASQTDITAGSAASWQQYLVYE